MAAEKWSPSRGGRIGLWLGIAAFLALLVVPVAPENPSASRMAAVAALMAVWWVTDAIPLFATALMPLALYPLLGIMSGHDVAPIYFNHTILLFLGGFMIALTMEKWDLHRRIALSIIHVVGGGPARIVLGFMIAAAFLSMWISNTATAVMMVPIGLAIALRVEDEAGKQAARPFSVGLMLGIAYGASAGGLTTLVGTPPNLAFERIFGILFPDAPAIGLGQWMVVGVPVGATLLAVAWLLITHVLFRVPEGVTVDRSVVEEERGRLGKMAYEEKVVSAVFAATVLLWVLRTDLKLPFGTIPGWSGLLPFGNLIDDGTVAIAMASILFFVPARSPESGATRVMGPDVVPRLPWHIVLLFGGGFAIAAGFQQTGLAQIIGGQFTALGGVPPFLLILLVCGSLTFLTELTSNAATTEMILPILASVAVATGTHPLLLMIPATLSASCAFMMPVATPPNAIVFGTERIKISDMARTGILLNLVGVLVVATVVYTLGLTVFDIDPGSLPAWAETLAQP